MTPGREIIENAKRIRQKLRYPENAVPDRGINLTRESTGYKGSVPPPDTPPKKTLVEEPKKTTPEPIQLPVNFNEVLRAVSTFYMIEESAVLSPVRTADLVRARRVVIYLSRQLLANRTLSAIARELNKDHTSILYAYRRVHQEYLTDPILRDDIKKIGEMIANNHDRFAIPAIGQCTMAQPPRPGEICFKEQEIQRMDYGSQWSLADAEIKVQSKVDPG